MLGCPHGRWVRCAWILIPTWSSSGRRRRGSSTSLRPPAEIRRLRERCRGLRRDYWSRGAPSWAGRRCSSARTTAAAAISGKGSSTWRWWRTSSAGTRRRGRSLHQRGRGCAERRRRRPQLIAGLLVGDAVATWACRSRRRATVWARSSSRCGRRRRARARRRQAPGRVARAGEPLPRHRSHRRRPDPGARPADRRASR